VGINPMSLYYIATTPFKSAFAVMDEDQSITEMPPGYVVSGWPPFEADSNDAEEIMHAAIRHISECEYLNLWHIYMN